VAFGINGFSDYSSKTTMKSYNNSDDGTRSTVGIILLVCLGIGLIIGVVLIYRKCKQEDERTKKEEASDPADTEKV